MSVGKRGWVRPAAYVEREAFLVSEAAGRRVLHLGCIGAEYSNHEDRLRQFARGLHAQLAVVGDVVGVDISADEIASLGRAGMGEGLLVGDVEHLDECVGLEGDFDVVIGGDIIEHLSNPGLFLEGILPRLRHDGRLILTTPNPFGLPRMARFFFGRFRENDQHTASFNANNLVNLLSRYRLRVDLILTAYHRPEAPDALFRAGRAVLGRWPAVGGTVVVVASKV